MESYLLDIQRCSIHDGPGIRTTVFFKGCPLRCKWCHNPESQSFDKQLSFVVSKCIKCGQCEKVCPNTVHKMDQKEHYINYEACKKCGECIRVCPTTSLDIKGKKFDLEEVIKIIMQDIAYYKKSKGGVTLSGGEVLSHRDVAVEILKACKKRRIHTCIETSGIGSLDDLRGIVEYVDLVLYDYKHTDERLHKAYVGVSNKRVLESLDYLQQQGKKVILRCPMIPGVNDTQKHLDGIIHVAGKYSIIEGVELLPYHNIGRSKATSIGEEQELFRTPDSKEVRAWINYCKKHNVKIV